MADQIDDMPEDLEEVLGALMGGAAPQEGAEEELIEQDDGSVIVPEEGPAGVPELPFNGNLATILSPQELVELGSDLIELIELDIESRKKRDEQYEEGIRRTGLGNDAPGGGEFEGASKAVHPVMAEACVDYSAAAIKELMPPDGPVKIHFLSNSEMNTQIIEAAEGKRDFYNWQLTKQIPEYRPYLETLLTQEPLGGSQYLKFWHDRTRRRPACEFVPVDKVHIPYGAASFYSADRATLEVDLTRLEFKRRVKAGMYIDLDTDYYSFDEQTKSQKATEKVEGVQAPATNEDGYRCVYEVYTYRDIRGSGDVPYIITIDKESRMPISIYRNWEEADPLQQKLDWVVEFQFIPWRGAYGVGLPHLIGGLSAAATGALRALLDSAHIQNFPGAMKLKGARSSGQNVSVAPTEIVELDAPAGVDDIRKVVMANPFPGPSPVLFQLLGFVVEAAKGVVSTAEEKISDASNQMPVGTAMALIEQGSKVFSAIHARQHRSQEKVLEILDRINRDNFDPEVQVKTFGKVIAPIEIFQNTNNIAPASDPNVFSESHRFAQIQGVQQLAAGTPDLPWNKMAIAQRTLRLMHVDNASELLPEPPKPVSADPDQEISAAMSGQQLAATPDMDHMWHIHEELAFLLDPIFGAANPVIMSPGFGVVMADIMAHMQMLRMNLKQQAQQLAFTQFQQAVFTNATENGFPAEAAQQLVAQALQDPAAQQQIRALAMQLYQQEVQRLAPLVQQLQQADQLVKQKTPPPPMPPEVQAQVQIAQAETQRKAAYDQGKLQIEQADMQRRQQEAAIEVQMEQRQQQFENMLAMQTQRTEEAARQLAQQVEIIKNDADNKQHQITELLKNRDDNHTNMLVEQMRQEGLRDREEMAQRYKDFQAKLDRILEAAIAEQKLEIEDKKVDVTPSSGE